MAFSCAENLLIWICHTASTATHCQSMHRKHSKFSIKKLSVTRRFALVLKFRTWLLPMAATTSKANKKKSQLVIYWNVDDASCVLHLTFFSSCRWIHSIYYSVGWLEFFPHKFLRKHKRAKELSTRTSISLVNQSEKSQRSFFCLFFSESKNANLEPVGAQQFNIQHTFIKLRKLIYFIIIFFQLIYSFRFCSRNEMLKATYFQSVGYSLFAGLQFYNFVKLSNMDRIHVCCQRFVLLHPRLCYKLIHLFIHYIAAAQLKSLPRVRFSRIVIVDGFFFFGLV